MPDKMQAEIFVAMNESGEYAVALEDCDAIEALRDEWGAGAIRVVKLIVAMTAPVVDEIEVSVSDSAGEKATVEAA